MNVGWITPVPNSTTTPRGGKLAIIPSCWATRTSLALTDTAMPTTTAQPANRGVKRSQCEENRTLVEHA